MVFELPPDELLELEELDELLELEDELPLALYTSNSVICAAELALSIMKFSLVVLTALNVIVRSEPMPLPDAKVAPLLLLTRRQLPTRLPPVSRMITVFAVTLLLHLTETR